MISKALWHLSNQKSAWRETELATTPIDHCQIQSLYSFISLGTEKTVASGMVPPQVAKQMEVPYMEGTFDFPLKFGYSLVGKIQSENHPHYGKLVHVMHPHQSVFNIPNASITILPDSLPAKRAVLTSNLETALNACWDAAINSGDKVLLVGFGNIGALLACVINEMPAVDLHILEKNESRIAKAKTIGFTNVHHSISTDDFDIAFHCSASEKGLQTCIDSLGEEGKVVELSWYGTKSVNLKLGANFHHRRLKIISSQVSKIPASHRPRWDYKRRKSAVLNLLQNPIYDQVLTNEISMKEAPHFFTKLRTEQLPGLGYCLHYGEKTEDRRPKTEVSH